MLRRTLTLALFLPLAACNAADRLSEIGKPPAMAPMGDTPQRPLYQPVSLPMPEARVSQPQANSLWKSGSRSFFKDQRAGRVGDILTVVIKIDDQAQIDNSSTRSRDSKEGAGIPGLFGLEAELGKVLPDAVSADKLVDASSNSSNKGTGAIKRGEKIELKVAAVVSQVLPNGNMVIQGRQEVRVNFELRELLIAGVIRPEDIASDNTVPHDKIAEARISYGGRGQISDVQQPRYGQQVFDVLMPF